MQLVVQHGARNATVRAISAAMAVNEAALYRHYRSKEEILASAYVRVVEEMLADKRALAKSALSLPQLIKEWIRLTYAYYDRHPDAFAYVLLLPPPTELASSDIVHAQGKLFLSLLRRAQRLREMPPMPSKLAYSHFSGIMLNIPRLIHTGTLRGPALRYVDACAAAACAVLGIEVGA